MNTASDLITRLKAAASVNDPFIGEATSQEMAARSPLWPEDPQWADVESGPITHVAPRRVEEYVYLNSDGRRLPVVAVFEESVDGEVARIYSDHHLVEDRAPIIPVVEGLTPSLDPGDVLHTYFERLPDPDPDVSVQLFAPDGYIQHSNGRRYVGIDELREDFTNMKRDNGGGINIKYCRVGDDGRTLVLECLMPSGRPAVAIYERADDHLVKAVRISL